MIQGYQRRILQEDCVTDVETYSVQVDIICAKGVRKLATTNLNVELNY